jgi:hypothetical protein
MLNPAPPENFLGLGAALGLDDFKNRPGVDQETGSEASDDVALPQGVAHASLRDRSLSFRLTARNYSRSAA